MAFERRPIGQPGFRSIGSPTPELEKPNVAESLIGLAQTGVEFYARQKDAEQSAAQAQTLNQFEESQLDIGELEQLEMEDPEAGLMTTATFDEQGNVITVNPEDPLTPLQRKSLTSAERAARKLSLLERQGGVSNRINQMRIALYRDYKQRFPELTPELRHFFEQQVGKTPIELQSEVAENEAEAARKEQDEIMKTIDSNLDSFGLLDPGMTDQEKFRAHERVSRMTFDRQRGETNLTIARNRNDLSELERKITQQDSYETTIDGRVSDVTAGFKQLLAQADPTNPNKTRALIQQANALFDTFNLSTKSDFDRIDQGHPDAMIKILSDLRDDAVSILSGKDVTESYEFRQSVLTSRAINSLTSNPKTIEIMEAAKILKNVGYPDTIIGPKAEKWGLSEMLNGYIKEGEVYGNAYANLVDRHDVEFANQAMRANGEMFKVMAENAGDDAEQLNTMADLMVSYSKEWTDEDSPVPVEVGDGWLETTADAGAMKALNFQPRLTKPLTNALDKHYAKTKQTLATQLVKPLDVPFEGVRVRNPDAPEADFLTSMLQVVGIDTNSRVRKPTLADIVQIDISDSGDVSFSLRPEAVAAGVRAPDELALLNSEKLAGRLSKFSRSYAHLNIGKATPAAYKQGAEALLSEFGFNEFKKSTVELIPTTEVVQAPRRRRFERQTGGGLLEQIRPTEEQVAEEFGR